MTTTVSGDGPGPSAPPEKLPGHWLLAKLGKRVLRPGGLELTRRMLDELKIGSADHVVEFAPGLGITARLVLERGPASYVGVERNDEAAAIVREALKGFPARCAVGDAAASGLDSQCATVVYGEAMLSMQLPPVKNKIVAEAFRLLRAGGRYGIHELCLVPDDLGDDVKAAIQRDLSDEIHVGVRPLTASEWSAILEEAGFSVTSVSLAPMHLLEPSRLIKDEGFVRALRFAWNMLREPAARRRVSGMRRTFRKWKDHLSAIVLVGQKPAT